VRWEGINYWLESGSGYSRKSTITECEDVSYVSSAYIPQCLRYGGRPTLSNAHRSAALFPAHCHAVALTTCFFLMRLLIYVPTSTL
jgi:hypothetical protein